VSTEAPGPERLDRSGVTSADPYQYLSETVGVVRRDDLTQIRMSGRDPARMLNGLITNDISEIPGRRAVYAAMLTPKGRIISDLRVVAAEHSASDLVIILPRNAEKAVLEHLRKYVPPMYAKPEPATTTVIGVYGPRSADLLRAVLGQAPDEGEDSLARPTLDGSKVIAIATGVAGRDGGFDLLVPEGLAGSLEEHMVEGAGTFKGGRVDGAALEVRRIEAAVPRYGLEISDETLPAEVYESIGMMPRAVSFTKGCYTGQEVVVRIAHRGHVNRHLRGLLLGEVPPPPYRTPLNHPESGKEIGWTTSAANSPLCRQTIALAFVRREVEIASEVRVGSPDGPIGRVVGLPFTET
jgi:tRNA-modifying protein YgfZ